MSVEIYLGNPPANITQWIIDHSQPVGHPETRVKYSNGSTATYNIVGELATDSCGDSCLEIFIENVHDAVEIDIGNTVTSIGEYAFVGCIGLTSVTIPSSVTNIRNWAFEGCSGLTSVTIPNGVVGNWVFEGCSGLMSVTISSSVTNIGYEAFKYCSSLTSVTYEGRTRNDIENRNLV